MKVSLLLLQAKANLSRLSVKRWLWCWSMVENSAISSANNS